LVTCPVVCEKLNALLRVYVFGPCPIALIVPTAYIVLPHGTSRRTAWFGVLLSRNGVFVEGTEPTVGVAAAAAELNPKSAAPVATPARNTIDFSFISRPDNFYRQRLPCRSAVRNPFPGRHFMRTQRECRLMGKDCQVRCPSGQHTDCEVDGVDRM
jgi:hypothetical protein